MLKKQSKKLAIMLVLSMIASLFVGVGTASAANGVAVSVSRVVSAEGDAGKMQIGNMQIKEDSDYTEAFSPSGDSFIITLPTNLKWDSSKYTDGTATLVASEGTISVKISGSYTMTVNVTGVDAKKDTFTIPMYVNFDGIDDGYAYATIDGLDSPVPSGDYAVANVLGGGTTTTCSRTFTAGPDTDDYFNLRITETSVGSFDGETDRVKITLPSDVDIDTVVISALGGFTGADYTIPAGQIDDNKAEFYLDKTGFTYTKSGDTARGILELKVNVNIDASAKAQTVNVDVESSSDSVDDATVKVGTIAEYGVALSVEDPTTVLAGSVCQEVGTLVIYENVPQALTEDRSITITLPDGVQFAGPFKKSDISVKKGTGDVALTTNDDESYTTFKISKLSATTRTQIKVDIKNLNIRADFTGDIVATISGRAGVEGEVVLGTVAAPVEVAVAQVSDVKIGYQDQALSDITVTETEAGALLEDGYVTIELPTGVQFQDKAAKVEVTSGNLAITSVKVKSATDKANAYVQFKIDSESSASQPGTVTISNLYMDVDRTVSEGPIKAIVKGDAIVQSYDNDYGSTKVAGLPDPIKDEYDGTFDNDTFAVSDYTFDEDEVGRFVIANCVTPGSTDVKGGTGAATSTFVVGSSAASIGGADATMPVAPYISNSRTMLPVRYVAYACGIPEANVIWNPDNQTVTLLSTSGSVVQLTIGSSTMSINGVAVVMDVVPEITGGYTFLPARYVANAFSYEANWEAATQTVTITPIVK